MANKLEGEEALQYYQEIASKFHIDLDSPARVVVARDTRKSGPRLLECLKDGLQAAQVPDADVEQKDYGFKDFGYATTPQLHYIVRCLNTQGTPDAYGIPTKEGYYEKFGAAFKNALKGKKTSGSLTIDCANGVGGVALPKLLKELPSKEEGGLEIVVINDNWSNSESLNVDVSFRKTQKLEMLKLSTLSAAPTMLKQTKELHRHRKLAPTIVAALLTEMLIALSTISRTRTTSFVFLMATVSLLLWRPF
jgi:phosphomannomutase